MLSYPNGSYPKQWVLKTPAGRDSCEATVVCPQSVVATVVVFNLWEWGISQ